MRWTPQRPIRRSMALRRPYLIETALPAPQGDPWPIVDAWLRPTADGVRRRSLADYLAWRDLREMYRQAHPQDDV